MGCIFCTPVELEGFSMIEEVTIENYKSIQSLTLPLGRVTVLIGENGCGKSNILEAIALGSAAVADKLDNEFLASRGIRVTDPKLMRSAFDVANLDKEIKISFKFGLKDSITYLLSHDKNTYSGWIYKKETPYDDEAHNTNKLIVEINELRLDLMNIMNESFGYFDTREKAYDSCNSENIRDTYQRIKTLFDKSEELRKLSEKKQEELSKTHKILMPWAINYPQYHQKLQSFLLFIVEFSSLKSFEKERQIQPLGINGEGLFKYLKYLSQKDDLSQLKEIKEKLELIDWFEDFEVSQNLFFEERVLRIRDRYIDPDLEYFDQKSANEGFLFLLFYFCLFIGEETPKFFAIDNIDSSLNPRLCRRLIEDLVELAKKHDKQVILTTHNPAVLDGLDLHDEEQKLYVINRKLSGHTRADQVFPPKAPEGKKPVRLSEAFLRGYIGGLPENF
jgi:AAA15 family ATPase/GTPase